MAISRIFVIPDVHVPYQDDTAWGATLQAVREYRPHHVVLLGDFADFYSVSAHSRDPARATLLKDEVAEVNRQLDRLQKAAGKAKVVFIRGNHEFRLERYIRDKAPELFGLVDVAELFRLGKRGWEDVAYLDSYKLGHIRFTHELQMLGQGVARKSAQAVGACIISGHTHRAEQSYDSSLAEGPRFGLTSGWLGSVELADYRHRNLAQREWMHGFSLVTMHDDGCGWARFVPVLAGGRYELK